MIQMKLKFFGTIGNQILYKYLTIYLIEELKHLAG